MENISFPKTLAVTGLTVALLVAGTSSTMAQFGENRSFERPALTEEQKDQLKEVAGDREAVKALLEEFGVKAPGKNRGVMKSGENRQKLTDEQKEALKAAHQSGDREQVKALLEEYGIEAKGKQGGERGGKMMKGAFADLTEEQRESLQAARESGDREAVEALMEEYGIERPERMMDGAFADLTDEQKEALQEARESRDKDAMKALMDEYGIERPERNSEKREAVKSALESGDYDTFVELLPEDHPEVSESDFEKIQEMHEAHEAGDHETAKEIREELGLEMPHGGERRGERGEDDDFEKGNRPQLTDEQKEALKAAHQSGDREAVKELLEEYGIEGKGSRGGQGMRGNR